MKIESTEFTTEDIHGFVDDYLETERKLLLARLREIITQTEALLPSLESPAESSGESWNAIETLAHMATTSNFFGWLVHEVATKEEVDTSGILEMIKLRDIVTTDAVQLPPEALVKQLRDNVEKTIEFVETVPYADLRKTFDYVGRTMSAEDILRIPLCGHLESHIEQMRNAI